MSKNPPSPDDGIDETLDNPINSYNKYSVLDEVFI